MTAQWDDDVHHALHALLTGERQGYYARLRGATAVLARVLHDGVPPRGDWSSFRGAVWGAPVDPERHRGHRFVGYLQNHDQVGNRAAGDRIGATVSPGRLAAGAALLLTSPFTPMLFMGEEWGAVDAVAVLHRLPGPGAAPRRCGTGRRREFAAHGWAGRGRAGPAGPGDPGPRVLDWSEVGRAGPRADAALVRLARSAERRRDPDLADDRLDTLDRCDG